MQMIARIPAEMSTTVRKILSHGGKYPHAFLRFVPIEWGSGATISWITTLDMGI